MKEAAIAAGSPEHFLDCRGEDLLSQQKSRGEARARPCPKDH
jgi:hypothetical protein